MHNGAKGIKYITLQFILMPILNEIDNLRAMNCNIPHVTFKLGISVVSNMWGTGLPEDHTFYHQVYFYRSQPLQGRYKHILHK